ncbi:class I SAM-dependent methyltransferase [Methylocystis parvus]|uniref:Class I SAM-dependent methyltransferase n=1 Tax=Methylocystis parvus TaxID=134 RepID=A0A6B8M1Z7_9HYPH|nr:class I SAM-dependent methyltransferase [Methylocystis parvus]QGM96368.1 class I SAM-dependent methyltransferase [Methylocystis parvus]WBJ99791.1 class I SAM-dependent methyltransferase [Methylocystis parvus OBBP]
MLTAELIKSTERPAHRGAVYFEVLANFHKFLNPKNYLEIGTRTGDSLRPVTCPSIAIDPEFRISADIIGRKSVLHIFQKTSDDFFREHDPIGLFGAPLDLAFLDGLHWYEFLLRDFINTEKACRRNSVVILHDCIPTNLYYARRLMEDMSHLMDEMPNPYWWAGDVWKTVSILKKARPDLRIHAFDAPPTGLICITNLDPDSTVLEENYYQLVHEFADEEEDSKNFDLFQKSLEILPTFDISTPDRMARFFWL